MKIIQENEYLDTMKNEVEPYLKAHCREGYIPGAEDIYHEKNGIIGKIHVKRYLADDPKGVVVISHGFTEGAPKYEEMIYYFLQAGYHVYMPEQMGHGQSYRLRADPSLVHIDIWKRYVRDFLKVCHEKMCIRDSTKYIDDAESWGVIDADRWNAFYKWLYENQLCDKDLTGVGFSNEYLPQ